MSKAPNNSQLKSAAESSQRRLRIAIEKHRKAVTAIAPQIPMEPLAEEEPLHELTLILPSTLAVEEREEFGLQQLSNMEKKLRLGLLYDILDALKKALAVKSYLSRLSREPANKSLQTRAMSQVSKSATKVADLKRVYRRCFSALLSLGPSASELGNLQELKEEDLVMLSSWMEEKRYEKESTLPGRGAKEGERALPWIWRITPIVLAPGEEMSEALKRYNREGPYAFLTESRTKTKVACSYPDGVRACTRSL